MLIALDNIDEVIRIIRSSQSVAIAKEELEKQFGLDDVQAQAIVDMRLRTLTGLERSKIEEEYAGLMKLIEKLTAIISDKKVLLGVIKKELLEISDKFGDERRTKIGFAPDDMGIEDLIERRDVVITMTKLGYIKRMGNDNFRSQNRGGRGIKGIETLKDDYIDQILMTDTHAFLMFFTNKGRVFRLKTYEVPEAGRNARGTAVINLLQLAPDEKVSAVIPVSQEDEAEGSETLIMATRKGLIKRTPLAEYENVRRNGLTAIVLREDDELIGVRATDNKQDIFLVTRLGECIRFREDNARLTGRVSMGVRGIGLQEGDEVVSMMTASEAPYMLIVSDKGMGKLTDVHEFSPQLRGGKGVKCYKITEKTGNVVSAMAVDTDDEIMMINSDGVIIRMGCGDISILGRITSGVKLMNLEKGETVVSVARVREVSGDGPEDSLEDSTEDDSEDESEDYSGDDREGGFSDGDFDE